MQVLTKKIIKVLMNTLGMKKKNKNEVQTSNVDKNNGVMRRNYQSRQIYLNCNY